MPRPSLPAHEKNRAPDDAFEAPRARPVELRAREPLSPAEEVEKARKSVDSARGPYERRKARLEADLAALPAMTPEQRAAYEKAYWECPENKGVKAGYDAAVAKLAATVERLGPGIEASGSEEELETLTEAYRELAKEPRTAQRALDFAARCSRLSPSDRADLVEDALPNAQAYAIANPEAAGAVADSVEALARAMPEQAQALHTLASLLRARPPDLQALVTFVESQSGDFSETLAGVAAAHGLECAAEQGPDALKQLTTALTRTSTAAAVMVKALQILGEGLEQSPTMRATQLAARFVPMVGVIACATAFLQSMREYAASPNGGRALAVIGNFVSTVGALVSCIPGVGTVLGTAINLIGAGLAWVGSELGDAEEQGRREQLLVKSGVPPELARQMVEHPDAIEGLLAAGLDATQVQALLAADPEAAIAFGELCHDVPAEKAAELMQAFRDVAGETGVPVWELMRVATESGVSGIDELIRQPTWGANESRGWAERCLRTALHRQAEASR